MTLENIKREYLQLINSFLKSEITANDFSLKFIDKMKNDNRTFGDDLYDLLEEMFGEANSYTDKHEIYITNPDWYLTDIQLKNKATLIASKLTAWKQK